MAIYYQWSLGTPKYFDRAYDLKINTYKNDCQKFDFLADKQRELCSLNRNILQTVANGARLGIDECQHQFHMNRWNCTTYDEPQLRVFGGVLDIYSREKAFIHAITSAGVAYTMTRACSKGEISDCGCDVKVRHKDTNGKWEWGGCSDDVHYGSQFSKNFIDTIEASDSPQGLMNLHNNEAGRRAIRSNMELICKCHGVSGSCTVRVCWRKLKQFREVGNQLVRRFDGSTHVKPMDRKNQSRLRPTRKDIKRPSKKDLVYLEESPDFCFKNMSAGVLGTKGRVCNATSYGMDGCRLLCCGRGYQTVEKEVEEKCDCKFVWCCKVQCKVCKKQREHHFCN
ncbi:protein Wnt-1-like [Oppia nitens]|uniref:protein Wnt-1-like n=1 Tax=Oppia nitens TaxID=1686743 RepID=UPI0023DA3E4A|nr:protein Wnt-1-like [Oppia nitens]